MPISNRSAFRHCLRNVDVTSLTAVYGPVRTVVWQGSAGDRRPYADLTRHSEKACVNASKIRDRGNGDLPKTMDTAFKACR
jgi:hypothetical protein